MMTIKMTSMWHKKYSNALITENWIQMMDYLATKTMSDTERIHNNLICIDGRTVNKLTDIKDKR